ncbi:MAG: tRNA (adenosine(37)-N6)-dimethylallyltransferase MiaA [Planctomycetota bacterium]|nr:tRNA (adenosine(37)-N6)-dimethylallyltransferase MiaA [Planctomycetota bacterium]
MPQRLVVVVGATASGKSELALAIAEACAGEVVSADAFAVYRDMDIGTAKPPLRDRARVPHHLIDVLAPEDRCDAARWLAMAERAISDIAQRGKLPVVAGGTPLYIKLLLEGLSGGPPRSEEVRARLRACDPHALWQELQRVDPAYARQRHPHDLRRIVRALEVFHLTGRPYSSFHTTAGQRRGDLQPLLIGLSWERPALHARIGARTRALFDAGLIDEVRRLRHRLSPEAAQAVGYKEVIAWLDAGAADEAQCRAAVETATRRLARHQLTWLRRFPDIVWLPGDAPELRQRALELVRTWLSAH